ncbi:MAG: Chemotaxis protein CheY [Betaproteobacteria bacterium ADurb.Bin341]|nr:MAG: Chemotaxis protein CheY [Betaproteobacteria bacterium ADurb.Bin341]
MALTTALTEIRVLLVEPSSMQAGLATKMLANMGVLTIQPCHTGAEALAALDESDQPTVVVSSLYLQDMSGTDLVITMRGKQELEAVPFILISSETRPQVLEPIRQSGACSIVTKPFTEDQLRRAIGAAAGYLVHADDFGDEDIERFHVLLVDDSTASRRHIRRRLESLGLTHITEAGNGKEAVQVLTDSMIDLVITDYNMPEMDGYELLQFIRTKSWQAEIPVMMVTSEENEGRLAAVQKAGVSMICDKPFDASSIRRLILEAVKH